MNQSHSHAGPVTADQAVFTSIRTPTGEGYRIIAASAGLRPDERAEITRRAPSHDSLCSTDEATIGMIAFRMPGGRHCVGYCQYAGKEHTARGGHRVHTHFALLSPEDFAAFGNDPTRVHSAMGRQVHGQPMLKQVPSIEAMQLVPQEATARPCADRDACERSLALVPAALSGETLLICGFAGLPDALSTLWSATPKVSRPSISLSIGLKFSPTRQTQLNFTSHGITDADRSLRGLRVACADWASPRPCDEVWRAWIDFVRRRFSWGRGQDVDELTAGMNEPMPAESLKRVAALCDDLDAVLIADAPRLQELKAKYRGHHPASPTEASLLARFEKAAKVREAALSPAHSHI